MIDAAIPLNPTAPGNTQAAGHLLPLIYDELRHLARTRTAHLRPGQTLTPTELVHEAYLRVVGHRNAGFHGPGHLFFAVSRAMRDLTVENARRQGCLKRGSGVRRINLDDVDVACQPPRVDFLDLGRALDKLNGHSPDCARVVLLCCFGGLTHPEVAKVMGVSLATVERKWSHARAWLHRELSAPRPNTSPGIRPRPFAATT